METIENGIALIGKNRSLLDHLLYPEGSGHPDPKLTLTLPQPQRSFDLRP